MIDISTTNLLRQAQKLLIEKHRFRVPITRRVLARIAAQYPVVVPTRRLSAKLAMWPETMPETLAEIYARELEAKLSAVLR